MRRLLLNAVRPPVSVPLLLTVRPPVSPTVAVVYRLSASRLLRLNSARGFVCWLLIAPHVWAFTLTHLKHVTGSRYAPWYSGPCASVSHCCSAGTLVFDRACIRRRLLGPSGLIHIGTSSGTSTPTLLAVLSQLFCHTGLLRELLPAVGYALVPWVLGSQPLAVCQWVLGS